MSMIAIKVWVLPDVHGVRGSSCGTGVGIEAKTRALTSL